MTKIEDVMVRSVLTAKTTDTVYTISEALNRHRIGAIVITDSSETPIGIVTERDIIKALISYKEDTINKQAGDIMSSPLLTLEPNEDIESAAILMALNRIRRIPITENNKLVGLISYRDITNALRKSYHVLQEEKETLADRANKDSLTGLFNKGYITEQLKYQFELAKRSNNPMAVIMLDIDHFKKVNDTYGHQCGDEVLKQIAEILREKSRAINIVGRYGGEEFIIIGPIGDHKSSLYLAERLRSIIEKTKFECLKKTITLTISAGVAIWNPKIENESHLVKLADEALYTAKRSGRNQVRIAEENDS